MLLLALDTTTRRGSVSLVDASGAAHVGELPEGEPVATHLPAALARVVTGAGATLAEVGALAVAVGPGSFTGLRIGIATMQGMSVALGRPLFGVSGLDALAWTARAAGASRVVTWVDAWRGEVYASCYPAGEAGEEPTVDRPESLLAGLLEDGGGWTFIGDGADAYRAAITDASPRFRVADAAVPLLAEAVARLALPRAATGEPGLPGAVRALYVRRPDAELARSARRGQEAPGA